MTYTYNESSYFYSTLHPSGGSTDCTSKYRGGALSDSLVQYQTLQHERKEDGALYKNVAQILSLITLFSYHTLCMLTFTSCYHFITKHKEQHCPFFGNSPSKVCTLQNEASAQTKQSVIT